MTLFKTIGRVKLTLTRLAASEAVMPGGWRLSLGAKVQGETGSLENKLEFKATP
jgi:hypothetical protein